MNKTIFSGRLTKDPVVTTSSGEKSTTISKFTLAVDRDRKIEGQPGADFFNCVTFGKQAEFVEKYLKKGTKIIITGRMQNNNYTNKDGQQVYGDQVVIETIEFAESKKSGTTEETPAVGGDVTENIPEGLVEELPFS